MAEQRVIGVDLGGTKILAGIVDRAGAVGRRRETPTPTSSQAELLGALEAAVAELLEDGVGAIGFGIPSTIDQRSGRAVSSVNIPLADLDLRTWMRERFGLPVGIDNDANAATLAEWAHGAGRGTQHMVMLTLGTGVGGGLILDGPPCQGSCTGRGHLESLASGRAATIAAREVFGPAVDAHRLVRLAQEGDAAAVELLATFGHRLGVAIGSLVNIFNPELVVIGGGFAAAGDFLLGPAREAIQREALHPARDLVRVARAELGTAAGLVGAGLVAFEALDAVEAAA